MSQNEILDNLAEAVIDGDRDRAQTNARAGLEARIDPLVLVEQALSRGMRTVGDRFECGEAFLPELLMAADTFNAAMEVIRPQIEAQKKSLARAGKVLIGTVKGDVHTIGKNIVATVLQTGGLDVIDAGTDVPSLTFIEEADKAKADVIALSSLMTTTMPGQKEVIDTLKEMKQRDRYLVVVGGGPTSQEWADSIGADGYGRSAVEGPELVKELIGRRR